MHDHRKRKRIFHVIMLHPCYSNVHYSNSCFVEETLEDPGDLPLWQLQGDCSAASANDNELLFGKTLFPEQRSTLRDLRIKPVL